MRALSLKDFSLPEGQNYHIYRIGGSDISQQPHSHDYYQLCYVVCGQIQHWQGDEPVTLYGGDAFLVPPGFVHAVVFPDSSARMYSLSFTEDLFHPGFSRSNVYRFMTALKLETMESQRLDVRMKIPLDAVQRKNLQALLDCLIAESESGCPAELASAASLIAAAMCVVSQGYFAQPDRQEQLRSAEDQVLRSEGTVRFPFSVQPVVSPVYRHDFKTVYCQKTGRSCHHAAADYRCYGAGDCRLCGL